MTRSSWNRWVALCAVVGLGCAQPPGVTSLAPTTLSAGEVVTLRGVGLSGPALVGLRGDRAPVLLDGVVVDGSTSLSVRIPEDLPPGRYAVEVLTTGTSLAAPAALEVRDAVAESVCAPGWTTSTSVALTRGLVSIVQLQESGARRAREVATADITGVEYEVAQVDDDALCAVIWLRLQSGQRVSFDHRRAEDLSGRAGRLARELQVGVQTTRQDADVVGDASDVPADEASPSP